MDLGLVHLSRLPRPTRLSLRGGVCLLKKSAQGSACVSVQVQPGKDALSQSASRVEDVQVRMMMPHQNIIHRSFNDQASTYCTLTVAVLGGFHQDSDGLMPTLLQRIRALAEGDLERERSWRAARKFALAAHDHQVVHVEGQEKQILPPGGLSAVLHYGDAELIAFLDSMVVMQQSYELFT